MAGCRLSQGWGWIRFLLSAQHKQATDLAIVGVASAADPTASIQEILQARTLRGCGLLGPEIPDCEDSRAWGSRESVIQKLVGPSGVMLINSQKTC